GSAAGGAVDEDRLAVAAAAGPGGGGRLPDDAAVVESHPGALQLLRRPGTAGGERRHGTLSVLPSPGPHGSFGTGAPVLFWGSRLVASRGCDPPEGVCWRSLRGFTPPARPWCRPLYVRISVAPHE